MLVAVVVLSCTVSGAIAAAHGPSEAPPPPPGFPETPEIPPIPDLGKPDDKAKFRVVVEGEQHATATVTGTVQYGPCTYGFENVSNTEEWNFARGRRVKMIFERFGRIVLMHRQGHPVGDTTLALVGTVARTSEGGYNEAGPPPCRGFFPTNQTNCNATFPVNSPLSLYWSDKHKLSLDRTASQSEVSGNSSKNPAYLCGTDGNHDDTAHFLYSYPFFLNLKLGKITNEELFERRRPIVLTNGDIAESTFGGTSTTTVVTRVGVTVRFIRLGD